jgi:hypothetical protein
LNPSAGGYQPCLAQGDTVTLTETTAMAARWPYKSLNPEGMAAIDSIAPSQHTTLLHCHLLHGSLAAIAVIPYHNGSVAHGQPRRLAPVMSFHIAPPSPCQISERSWA